MTRKALIERSRFVGLEDLCHLCTGGESPWLKTHADVFEQFSTLKSAGNRGREKVLEHMEATRASVARLWQVEPSHVSFLPSSSDAMNHLARGIDWREGDNIVTTELEFPSVAWAWRDLQAKGVEIRQVPHTDWLVTEEALLDAADSRTRLMAVSQVSYYTGQHLDIHALSQGLDREKTLFAVDATHASGVLPVRAGLSDLTVTSAYKWMLGTTGVAACYVSDAALEQVKVSTFGWHNMHYGPPPNPAKTELVAMPHLLEPGNPALLNIMILGNAISELEKTGLDAIAHHARGLAGELDSRIRDSGLKLISPVDPKRRSGNTCIAVTDSDALCDRLDEQNILVWGDRGRIRVSTHLYNDSEDVARVASAIKELA